MFGPILVILIWAIVAGVFLTVCIVFRIVGTKRKNWLPLKITLGLALCFFLLVGGWYGLGFVSAYIFYDNFGFAPTGDVTELQGYRFSILGYGKACLRFRAAPETVRRIVGAKYEAVPKEKFEEWMNAREAPPQWLAAAFRESGPLLSGSPSR